MLIKDYSELYLIKELLSYSEADLEAAQNRVSIKAGERGVRGRNSGEDLGLLGYSDS